MWFGAKRCFQKNPWVAMATRVLNGIEIFERGPSKGNVRDEW